MMRKGDILFNEVMSGRIVMTYLEDYKELLRGIVNDVLEKFSFFHDNINEDNEAGVSDACDNVTTKSANTNADDSDHSKETAESDSAYEESSNESNCSSQGRKKASRKRKRKLNFRTNLFEAEVGKMKRQHHVLVDLESDDENKGYSSSESVVTRNEMKHKLYKQPTKSKTKLCEKRATMEIIASKSLRIQGGKVNKKRQLEENYKQVLDEGELELFVYHPM